MNIIIAYKKKQDKKTPNIYFSVTKNETSKFLKIFRCVRHTNIQGFIPINKSELGTWV